MNTPDFRDRLQATLGSAYTLERELGGGGMSRVFVAMETALGRKVVVKVLPPDLAATVNVDRFRREIQLAARLQHAHIVPLLTTGISDGLPYYTMPLVTGESLRARLARTGELPIADAVKILRDVLSALSYAHDEGVVHRDIKPDNVLLSRHTAVVTDFGVAKALNAATDAHGALTSIGLTIGTPAYMAPEQAAADPSVDHRADIYSVGVMAYEMLTGMTLFGDRSPQRMLAAHAVEIPERVEKHRPSIPPLLASLVMTALEKRPADRPQSADEMLGVLDSIGTPSSISGAGRIAEVSQTLVPGKGRVSTGGDPGSPLGPGSKRWSRKSVAAALAAVSVVILAGLAITMAKRGDFSGKKGDVNLVVVVPFRVAGAEPSLSYLREGMLDLLAAKLTGEGGPRAADPRSVLSAWRRVARSDRDDLSQAETVRLAATLGAGQVILGGIVGTPSRIVVTATVLEVPSGKAIRQEVTVQGPADSLASLVDQLAVKLLSLQAGENQQHLAELASASLPAIRAYLEGKAAYRQAHYAASMNYFQRALAVDSTFALAAIGLFKAAKWLGSPLEGHGIRMTWENRDKLSGADRMFAAAISGPDYPVFPTARQILSALDSATKLGPDQPDLWFEFGDIMFHNGRSIGVQDAFAQAHDAFSRAYALDSSFAPAIEHLIELAVLSRDTGQVRRLATKYTALPSTANYLDYIRWRAATALGDGEAIAGLRKRLLTLGGESRARIVGTAIVDGIAIQDVDVIVDHMIKTQGEKLEERDVEMLLNILYMRGRQKQARELLERTLRVSEDTLELYPQRLAAMLYADADRTGDTLIVQAIRRSLPASRGTRKERAEEHGAACAVAVWAARSGDLRFAREMIPVLQRTMATAQKLQAIGKQSLCLEFIQGLLEMNSSPSSAPAVIERLNQLSLAGPTDLFWDPLHFELARLYEQRGDAAKALNVLRRRRYSWVDGHALLTTYLREEGRLAAKLGDRGGATRALRHFLVLREGADEALRPQSDSVRAMLASVESRSSR